MKGAREIGAALERNRALRILDLGSRVRCDDVGDNNLGDNGAKALFSALEKNASLISLLLRTIPHPARLHIENCKIHLAAAGAIANALANNHTLFLLALGTLSLILQSRRTQRTGGRRHINCGGCDVSQQHHRDARSLYYARMHCVVYNGIGNEVRLSLMETMVRDFRQQIYL